MAIATITSPLLILLTIVLYILPNNTLRVGVMVIFTAYPYIYDSARRIELLDATAA
jgi:hypothetical protein